MVLGFLILALLVGVVIQGYKRHRRDLELSQLEAEIIFEPPRPEFIDLNEASAQELEVLPGIGPVLAQRIVEYREHHGEFKRLEDLLNVPGIGEYKLKAISDLVRIE